MLERIVSIARADVSIRLRRASTVVVFLLLSACAYFWIPDPATGRALLTSNNRRALYNSASIGMATAALGTIFIGLFGFYVISNAVRRDIDSRCGMLLASTPMRNSEYVLGKFAGNLAFLTLFMSGFMASSMAMLLVRGEARLEPLVFMKQYALLVTPTLVFVSVIAIVFECTPFLAGRFGDVLYFFLWAGSIGVVATMVANRNAPPLIGAFDVSGFGYLLEQTRLHLHTSSLSIGASGFDAKQPPFVFNGMTLDRSNVLPRLLATIIPIAYLGVALLFFHRFDPARIRGARGRKVQWLSRLNYLAKPLARLPFIVRGGPVVTDATMTFTLAPWTFILWIGISIAALANPASLPVALAATAIAVADMATRDTRAGTVTMIRSAPALRERFVWWKFASTSIVAFAIMLLPLMRSKAMVATIAAVVFIAAAATALGVMTKNPRTFIVLFLSYWYVVINDKGMTPGLNLGGIHGAAPLAATASYAIAGFLAVLAADRFYRWRLSRDA